VTRRLRRPTWKPGHGDLHEGNPTAAELKSHWTSRWQQELDDFVWSVAGGTALKILGWDDRPVISLDQPLWVDVIAVKIMPVAAPGHPLALAGRAKLGATREHLQLVLTEQSATDTRDYAVVSATVWRLGDLASKHALLLAGIGWGGMPEPMVRVDLDAGRLVHLQLLDFRGGTYPLQIAHMNETPPGPAGQWLIECLINQDDRVALSDRSQKAKRGSPSTSLQPR